MFPYKVQTAKIPEKFQSWFGGSVTVGPKNYILSHGYKELKDKFYNFEVRSDDVWITGFPRTGTTMTEELVWLICNDLNFEKAKEQKLAARVPFFEFILTGARREKLIENPKRDEIIKKYFSDLTEIKERRFIKTHIPLSLLPPNLLDSGCKVLYCARNPKDVIVSTHKFFDLVFPQGYPVSMAEHFEIFEENIGPFSPYLEHLQEAWELRSKKNFMFVFYEDILKDKRQSIKNIAAFYDKNLTEENIDALVDYMDIDNFRKNASVNHSEMERHKVAGNTFIRQGKAGGWRRHFDQDLERRVDAWIRRGLDGTELFTHALSIWS